MAKLAALLREAVPVADTPPAASPSVSAAPASQPAGVGISGVVRLPDGSPAGGAQVVLSLGTDLLQILNGKLERRTYDFISITAPDGRYSFPSQDKPYHIVVMHDGGWRLVSGEDIPPSGEIKLEAWAGSAGSSTWTARPPLAREFGSSIVRLWPTAAFLFCMTPRPMNRAALLSTGCPRALGLLAEQGHGVQMNNRARRRSLRARHWPSTSTGRTSSSPPPVDRPLGDPHGRTRAPLSATARWAAPANPTAKPPSSQANPRRARPSCSSACSWSSKKISPALNRTGLSPAEEHLSPATRQGRRAQGSGY